MRIIIGKEFKALYRGETPFDKTENIRFKTGRRNSAHRKSRGAEKYLGRLIAREQVGRERMRQASKRKSLGTSFLSRKSVDRVNSFI